MSSKFASIMIFLTFLSLAAAFAFQFLEMKSFGLVETLKERFFKTEVVASSTEDSSDAGTASDTEKVEESKPEATTTPQMGAPVK